MGDKTFWIVFLDMRKKYINREALEKSYKSLEPFSEKYKADFKRFLVSLNVLSQNNLIKDKKILDLGSGIGITALAFKYLGGDSVGLDKFIFPEEENYYKISNSEDLSEIWKRNELKIIKADITETLPFNDESFDVITCDAAIEHLNSAPCGLFFEARRVLKQGGMFLVTTPNLTNLLRRIRFVFGISPYWDILEFWSAGQNFKGHRREFTAEELKKMLTWSGFEIMKIKTANVFFNSSRLFSFKKTPAQICSLFSFPFFEMREMIYVLAKK